MDHCQSKKGRWGVVWMRGVRQAGRRKLVARSVTSGNGNLFTQSDVQKLREEIEELEKRLQFQSSSRAAIGGSKALQRLIADDVRKTSRQLAEKRRALANAVLVESPANPDVVAIGVLAKISRDEEEEEWEIVGGESDFARGLLSCRSPLAQLIMGKSKGDVVAGTIAGKPVVVKVLGIRTIGRKEETI